jgi:predicted DCC family thiol-disulfide oxidoreductase YuxK
VDFPSDKKIILFDGVCNLCTNSVLFIIKRDHGDQFRFASLQSDTGKQFIEDRGIDAVNTDSIILLEPNIAYYTKSSAALKIGRSFGGPWKMLAIFEWIPNPIRDFFYTVIAKNRYRWFGKKKECMIPSPEHNSKFID